MIKAKTCGLAAALILASIAIAFAQSGGTASTNSSSGTGVKTGKGPLTQPIPPAVSTTNPSQNYPQNPQRPQNSTGPTLTNPPQQPFGTR